jgi:hypothetical protein
MQYDGAERYGAEPDPPLPLSPGAPNLLPVTRRLPAEPFDRSLLPVTVPVLPIIAQIGEIQVTPMTVRTPTGEVPLRGSVWHAQDQWLVTQKTATWAIVLAIVGFCCLTLFSLFFLLVKETSYSGFVQVTVTSGRFQYHARIPITSFEQVQHLHNQVNYVRAVAAQ